MLIDQFFVMSQEKKIRHRNRKGKIENAYKIIQKTIELLVVAFNK